MRVSYESVKPNKGCSFCTLHINVPVSELNWEYHYHPEVELVCVMYGNGTRQVGYHKSNYINGDLVLIGSNIPHSGFGLNALDPHEEIVVQFPENIFSFSKEVEEMTKISKLLSLSKLGILFSTKIKQQIIPKLYELLDANPRNRYRLLFNILFDLADTEEFSLLNKEVMPHTIISKNKDRLQTIFTYIEKNFKKEIAINEVAELVNLTLPSFCNFFKKATKITFTDFINQYRIDKACSLIAQGKTISEACYGTGYNSLSYFSRTFKKCIGKTPTEFRSELGKR